jgi:hypothetical protein
MRTRVLTVDSPMHSMNIAVGSIGSSGRDDQAEAKMCQLVPLDLVRYRPFERRPRSSMSNPAGISGLRLRCLTNSAIPMFAPQSLPIVRPSDAWAV